MNRYEQLADRLRNDIRAGLYPPGQRLPSVRRIAMQQQLSIATCISAYRKLEAQGWLEARPQSGFYARTPEALPPRACQTCEHETPGEVTMSERVAQVMRASHRDDLLVLSTAIPHADFLPVKDVRASLARALRHEDAGSARYGEFIGEESLRVQIARRAVESGCQIHPDDIVITTGCQEALTLALRATTRPGDVVAIESPAFFGTLQLIESLGLKALEIPTDASTGMSPDALELALERWPVKACLFCSSFSNPVGASMPDAHKRRILQMLTARDIPLIEDDIYGEMAHDGQRPRVAKAWDRTGHVLLCSSFSKTIAPGLRVGWIVPGRWRREVERLKYGSTMATALLPQRALADYLASGRWERHLNRVNRLYAEQMARMQTAIARHFPAGTRCTRPAGGFILWLELPEDIDALTLQAQALAAGISISPGPLFSPQGKYRNCVRLMCAVRWDAGVDAALATLGSLASSARQRSQ
jgi:DNA-binding transcriptional MocR family regulator